MKNPNEYSAEIKTEVLQIVEAFSLGRFLRMTTMINSTELSDYIFTQFETTMGIYTHYFRINNQ